MRRVFLLMTTLLCTGLAAIAGAVTKQGDWTLYKVGGRDYVAVENVADFYALGQVRSDGKDFLLKGGLRSLARKSEFRGVFHQQPEVQPQLSGGGTGRAPLPFAHGFDEVDRAGHAAGQDQGCGAH
jgi:hypothetical protein